MSIPVFIISKNIGSEESTLFYKRTLLLKNSKFLIFAFEI